eukprot:815882-Prymnesium_polylepis.2
MLPGKYPRATDTGRSEYCHDDEKRSEKRKVTNVAIPQRASPVGPRPTQWCPQSVIHFRAP